MELEDYLNKYKNLILNIAIIICAFIIASNIYKAQDKEINRLKENKESEVKKNSILDSIKSSDKRLKGYKNFLNKKDISLSIDNIGAIAKDSNARITSIKPEAEQSFPLYIKHTFMMSVSISDYGTLGKFISKLESSRDVYMIESIGISSRLEGADKVMKGLTVNLKVVTFLFKD